MALELVVGSTWDGQPADAGERAVLRLSLHGPHLQIEVDAPFHGDPAPSGPAGPTPKLWEHEVVELFVASAEPTPDAPLEYLEVELGPGGHHLVLQLRGIRKPVASELPIEFEASTRGGRWTGTATVPGELLPPQPWRMNAYAIHGTGAQRRYLAWQPVPGAHPDFHGPDRFAAVDSKALR